MDSKLFQSLAATAFAAMLLNFLLKRRSREISGGEANNKAAANDGTTGGDSGAHTATESHRIAGGASAAHTSTESHGTAANDGIAGVTSGAHTSTESHGMGTSSGYDYEVFLSFRGPDTREHFTDFLYTSLKGAGIRTFKDDEDLRKGEEFAPELLQAIKQSKILVPIFSKGYASSVWCLKEVAQMVECKKNGGQQIVPIFYDVATTEVRYQTGNYKNAFLSHESKKRYDKNTIGEWKDALTAVAGINGWDLQSMANRREGEFVKTFTQKVFNELKKASLVVSDCLVGVDDQVETIMEMIGAWTSETRIIGIHGMGGIGKTTIAKIVYNHLSKKFDNCCFLSNIREVSKTQGIVCLQKQLICDILKMECTNIRNSEEGTQTIHAGLSKKKILILLDDVDHKKHMDALVGNYDWLGKGSKLIITTRNKEVLKVPEVDNLYEVSIMDPNQSLQLFSKHAFRSDYPLDEHINQSKRAVEIAGGLPLALEIIGSLLARTEKEKWDVKLEKLEDVPREDVRNLLRISYDALEDLEKHIFLDIACLFIGYDKDIMVYFWESDFHPEDAMDVLENMSLIKIKDDSKVWMHDQLRDLGRQIIREESKWKIEEQSRVWDSKKGFDLLRRHEEKTKVQALRLKFDHGRQHHFTYEDFKRLSNLRFLEVDGLQGDITAEERLLWNEWASNDLPTNVFQENSNLLPQLRWLSWPHIPPTFNITNFSMEDVVILDLSKSEITEDWKGWSHLKVMKNLKILDLSKCEYLKRTPKFSAHSNLERLILRGCKSLIELDKSICQLKRLVFLDLRLCVNLRRLPDELGGDLASLEYLSLRQCINLERLPDTIGNLESLIELNISDMRIEELPNSIGKLKKLKVVNMTNSKIRKIPEAFWIIEKLEKIQASASIWDRQLRGNIDSCIYRNKSLRILRLWWMDIYAVPRLPEGLIQLQLSDLYVDTFPDLSNLANLKRLDLEFATRIRDPNGPVEYPMPPWIGNLSKLESLKLRCHFVTTSPTDVTLPPQLKELHLHCPNLRRLPTLPSSLSTFTVENCKSLCSVGDLSNLKKLSSLTIRDSAITEIQGLGCLENLRYLRIWGLVLMEILPDLSNLNKLTSLRLGLRDKLDEIQGKLPQSLKELEISYCESLLKLPDLSSWKKLQKVKILPDLSNLNKLRSLHVSDFDDLVEIQGELPQSLEELEINSCESLRKLPHLSSLKELQKVVIKACGNLVQIHGELPQSLEELEISYCKSLWKLPNLSSLKELQKVFIKQCGNLVQIQGELPKSLEELQISYCESLRKLPNLSSLKELQKVFIKECGNLVEIQGELPQSLEELEISYCKSLQKLPNLSSIKGLRKVVINECGNLVEIQGELPQSLEELAISFCESLRKLPNLSSIKGLRKVEINHCRKLNVKAISSLCWEKSVEFVGEDKG